MRENVLPSAGAFHDAGKRLADGGSISQCEKTSCRRQGHFTVRESVLPAAGGIRRGINLFP